MNHHDHLTYSSTTCKQDPSITATADNLAGSDWLNHVLDCVKQISHSPFELAEVYAFDNILSKMHPNNHHVHAKIRQELQFLRDKCLLEFLGKGKYRRLF